MRSIRNLIHGVATGASVFAPPTLARQQRYQPAPSAREALQGDGDRVGADMWKSIESVKDEQQIQESR